MSKNEREQMIDSPHFPYLLIRDHLLTNLLGNEADEILYWGGKELARQFPLTAEEDIIDAFAHCGFGILSFIKEDKNSTTYSLSGDLVATRLLNEEVSFQLEAGFLAEQLSRTQKRPIEAQAAITKAKEVFFNVQYY